MSVMHPRIFLNVCFLLALGHGKLRLLLHFIFHLSLQLRPEGMFQWGGEEGWNFPIKGWWYYRPGISFAKDFSLRLRSKAFRQTVFNR